MTAPTFTFQELAACARGEVKQRHRVYDRLVAEGKMTRAKADREIAMMARIADILDGQAAQERLI